MRIREVIEQQGMSTKDVADKMGISLSALNQSISGNPSVKVLTRISETVGVPLWQLFVSPEEVKREASDSITCPRCGSRIPVETSVKIKAE